MIKIMDKVKECAQTIRPLLSLEPKIGIILGTGLGGVADAMEKIVVFPYKDLPHFPVSTVEGHSGNLILGKLSDKPVLAMQGRFHYYEGYSMAEVTFPIRVMKELGIKTLIISNAAGGLNPNFTAGTIMLITDHINLMPANPLTGINEPEAGVRFVDMLGCYTPELQQLAMDVALREGIRIEKGVYVALPGPNFETPAEYRFLRTIGADAVGMSTVPEVIVAKQCEMRVLAFSIITDMCRPDSPEHVSHLKVIEVANRTDKTLSRLIAKIVAEL